MGARLSGARFRAALVALGLLAGAPAAAAQPARIEVVAPAWPRLTEADGEGLYWRLLRKVYEPAGVEVAIATRPYGRCVELVQAGEADAWPAAYPNEHDAVYPERPMDAEAVYAAYDPERLGAWEGPKELAGKRVAWIDSYRYDKYLPVAVEPFTQTDRAAALRQVAAGRVAAFLDARSMLEKTLATSAVGDRLALGRVTQIKLYMAYSPGKRGRRLAAIWDKRLPKLLADGTVARLFASYDWQAPQWPFAAPSPFDRGAALAPDESPS